MPGMNGITLANVIKSDPICPHPGHHADFPGQLMDDEQLAKAGIDACLVKPVKHARLYECLTGLRSPPEKRAERRPAAAAPSAAVRTCASCWRKTISSTRRWRSPSCGNWAITPEVATNGLEAVEAPPRTQFDVILMDCQMPQMDGYEATRANPPAGKGRGRQTRLYHRHDGQRHAGRPRKMPGSADE